MAAARQLARDQHLINLTTLEGLNGRRGALQSALVVARSALERAQADIAALEPELATVEKMRDVLIPEIKRQKRLFSRALLDTFPPELLCAIFLEVVSEPDAEWPESNAQDGTYNTARNALPFQLSAVCRRWRSVALDVAALWAYVGVPRLGGRSHTTHTTYFERIKALLERSKQHPLDVMLDWRQHEGYPVTSWQDCRHYQVIFDAVGLHVKRWRRVQMTLPEGVSNKHLAWLCERAPLLEDCSIVPSAPSEYTLAWSEHQPRHLPYCPRLKRLCCTKMFVSPDHPLPLLLDLHIQVERVPLAALWSLLRNTHSLQTLVLQLPSDPIDDPEPPIPALELRTVTKMGLYGDITFLPPVLASISMPALACLEVYSDAAEDMHLFCDTVVYQVSKLALGQGDGPTLDGETARRFSALEQLRELELTDCDSILAEFFRELVADGGLWPKLEAVKIDGGSLDDDTASAFLLFVQSRGNAREAESLSPFRVSLTAVAMPAWLNAHVRARFGDAAVQLEMSSDGTPSAVSRSPSVSV